MTLFSPASRVQKARISPYLAANQKAGELAAQGRDIVNLTIGEPDFNTPDHIVEAACRALRDGDTRYPPTPGRPALREAVCAKLLRENRLSYLPDEILIGNGAKQIIACAFAGSLDAGDAVLIPAPHWASYDDSSRFFEGRPVIIPCPEEDGFKLTPDALEKAITPDVRWLALCSPSNPSGAIYSESELALLADVLRAHPRILVLLDEVYEHIRFIEPPPHFLEIAPDLKDRTLVVNSFSKTYAMPGWRVGFGAGPKELIRAMTLAQAQILTGVATVSQAAALAALTGPQDFVAETRDIYAKRRDIVARRLSAIPELSFTPPDGSFFAFPGCARLLGLKRPDGRVIESDLDAADYFLEEAGVATVPGAAFNLSPYFRISFAVSTPLLEEALSRIERSISRLRK